MIRGTAAIIQKDNKILIAQRRKDKNLGLKWEFPGGKIDKNETPEECLSRELKEEFGIKTKVGKFITNSIYKYPNIEIDLMAYYVDYLDGEFKLIDHERIEWVSKDNLKEFDFAEADIPIIDKLLSQ